HMASADGKRHYRIDIAIPRQSPPAAGFPVLYMLDGNAVMVALTKKDLETLARTNPPVLVAIGYDTPARIDVVARAYDYTPPVLLDGKPIAEPLVRGQAGGGANR